MSEPDLRVLRAELCAVLVRRFGVARHAEVEDAVQEAVARMLARTPADPPDDAGAWLYRVASNHLLGEAATRQNRARILNLSTTDVPGPSPDDAPAHLAHELPDAALRMLFVCCDPTLPAPSQLALALSVLCGLTVDEVALRLFASKAHIYKRLARARTRLRTSGVELDALDDATLAQRLPAVHHVLYLMFTEGHLATQADRGVRRELCADALRLALLLTRHPTTDVPATSALVALFHLHASRLDARVDADGHVILLDEQDRAAWDRRLVAEGLRWLARSARGDALSRYHLEAEIAAEHSLAPSFSQTRWERLVTLYAQLDQVCPSPLHALNRALAIAEVDGPRAALVALDGQEPPAWLEVSHLWSAVLADLHRRAGDVTAAEAHRQRALASAPGESLRAVLARRLAATP